MLASGVLIDERYQVDQLAGRGGMAEVFRATDTTTGRLVALKLLRSVEPPNVRRFQAEIEVLRRLRHPGVVELCGTGAHDGVPYLVLELVDGPSLADQLAVGPVALERTIGVGEQLAAALAYAHETGVVHRDVKPSNVLFDGNGRVRLADFGIAHLADGTRMTASGRCVGTAAYLAPEQLDGRIGPAADVYALGLVLIECLTGNPCYPGGLVEAAMARLHRSPAIPEDLPAWLRTVLAAMTARNPAWRPSAGAVADALERRSADAIVPLPVSVAGATARPDSPSGLAFQDVTAMDTAAVLPLHQPPPRPGTRARRGITLARVPATVAAAGAVLAVSLVMWLFTGTRSTGTGASNERPVPVTAVDETRATTTAPARAPDPAPAPAASSGDQPTGGQPSSAVVGDDAAPPANDAGAANDADDGDDGDDADDDSGPGNGNGNGHGRGGGNGRGDDGD